MTTRRPSKPWKVIATGPDVTATSCFTSENKAFAFVRTTLSGDSPADAARVECWENGRWHHFETMTKADIAPAAGGGAR